MTTRSLLLFLAFIGTTAAHAQEQTEERLPIRRIVLYKHGVGYFEREGTVQGDATVPLSFKAPQMKDVLKSLYAVDLDGGRIVTIVYDSKDPLSKQLEDILVRLPEGNALTELLRQLKGARVRVMIGASTVEGRILGLEPITRTTETGTSVSHRLVLLREDGLIEAVELFDAAGVEILDEGLRSDLARMMEIHARSRRADRKVVSIRAEGEGDRRLRVGYIIETPIWKTSYRILMEGDEPPLVQGWAIVENQTDEDWRDVRLSFVAGSPISFVMDLYTSYYPDRPEVQMGVVAAPPPAPAEKKSEAEAARAGRRGRADRAPAEPAQDARAGEERLGRLLEISAPPAAVGEEVGALFSYTAQNPVSIRQGQAALVPILQERLEAGGRILSYRADLSRHPSHAFDLRNATELTLERGPVTFFEGATCLGEGLLLKTLAPGEHAVIPYALETSVEVDRKTRGEPLPVTRATLVNGVLTLHRKEALESVYAIRNKSGEAHELWLDHPKSGSDYRLSEPPRAAEELPEHYRFEVPLAPGAPVELLVREEREVSSQIAVLSQSSQQIRFYLQQQWLSEADRAVLEQVAGLMEERARLERAIEAAQAERTALMQDQERVRKNMEVLRDTPKERTVRDEYLERLLRSERRLEELRELISTTAAQRESVDRSLAETLRSAGG